MLEFIANLPPWAIKLGALMLALIVVIVSGLGLSRLFRKLTDRAHLE